MPFCWLCTHSEANCMFTPLGSERSAAPADSVIPGLRVCRHVSAATGLSTSLGSLHIERQYRGLTRGLPRKFLPSPFQFVQDAGPVEPGQRPLERACISSETAELGSLVPQNKMHKWRFLIFYCTKKPIAKPVQHVKSVALCLPEHENQSATKLCSKWNGIFRACSRNSRVWWHCSDEIPVNGLWKLYLNYADVLLFFFCS